MHSKDRRQIPCLRLQPSPPWWRTTRSSRLVSPWICCRSLISRLVSSPGKQLHCTPGKQHSCGKAAASLASRPAAGFGATTRNPPELSASISPSPRSLDTEVPTPSRADDPYSPDLRAPARAQGDWSPVAGPFPLRTTGSRTGLIFLSREERITERASWPAGRGTGTTMPMGPRTPRPSTPKSTALVRRMRHGRSEGGRNNWRSDYLS